MSVDVSSIFRSSSSPAGGALLCTRRRLRYAELRVFMSLLCGCRVRRSRRMCAMQLLRVSVHERINAAAAEVLLRLENGGKAAELPVLRALLTERLTAAAEEIVALLEETVAEYEERLERKERELRSQRRLLDAVLKPQVLLNRADVKLPVEIKQEERRSSLDSDPEEDPSVPPLIKEEPQEAEISQFSFNPVGVKTEEDEEKPQLHHGMHSGGGAAVGGGAAAAGSPKQEWSDSSPEEASCSFCGKRFRSGGEVTRHMWLHTGEELLRCVVCHDSFSVEEQLLAHRCARPASPPRATFSCSLCHHSFSSREELSAHTASHVTCSVCRAAFVDTDALILHMRGHGTQTQFSCSVCGKDFAWRRHLTKHMEVHRNKKVYRYSICRRTLCRRRTRLGQRRCIHRPGPAHEHQGEEPSVCSPPHHHLPPEPEPLEPKLNGEALLPQSDDSVDSDFWKDDRKQRTDPSVSDDQQLEASVTGVTPKPESGPEVDPPAEISVSVDGSSGAHAAVQKRFACSQCGKSFQYSYLLRRHLRTHTGEKPFTCSVCGKRFSQKENLVYHMGLHTGHKRFSCSVCQRRFNWLSGVKRHICVPEGDEELEPIPGLS